MTLNQTQILKFIIVTICAILGVYLYIINGGTLFKAWLIWCYFGVFSKLGLIGYHRWLAHRYFEPGPILKYTLLYSIVASTLVPPLNFVVGHKIHHRYPDTDNDPHPPKIGFFNALIGNFNEPKNINISVKELYRYKEVIFVHNHYYKLCFLHLLVLFLIDVDTFLLSFAFSSFKYLVYQTHFNYVSHGGKNQTGPRNLPWYYNFLVIGVYGEQFHKNHHDDPSNPNFGNESFINSDWTYHMLKKVSKVREIH